MANNKNLSERVAPMSKSAIFAANKSTHRTMKLVNLLFAAVCCLPWISCSEALDGDWPPMKWKTDIPHFDKNHISVTAEGDSLAFRCTNYGDSFWANCFIIQGQYIEVDSLSWARLHKEGDLLSVIVAANPGTSERAFYLQLEAGDAFDVFYFVQAGRGE
jgi:hypothetical protein